MNCKAKPFPFGGKMLVAIAAAVCVLGCRQPLEPANDSPLPERPTLAAPIVPTDSACRTVTITLVGNNDLSVAFPNRAQCGSGLVLIQAGNPTRSGGGKRNVNLPVRLLNSSSLAIKTPATISLLPSQRQVLAPVGEAPSKIAPQNHDSVRSGSGAWVWIVGSSATIPPGDSTGLRSVTIRLESPVTSGRVTLTMEAIRVTPQGWTILTSNTVTLDASKLIQRPGTSSQMYRTAAVVTFVPGVSDVSKQSYFAAQGLTVLGVTTFGWYYVTFADPGQSISAFDTKIQTLRSQPGVAAVTPVFQSGGMTPINQSRYPSDSLKRDSWLGPLQVNDVHWAMKAIRAPMAWGCETGTYTNSSLPPIAQLELFHGQVHTDIGSSVQSSWEPSDISTTAPSSLGKRDSGYLHAAQVGGILSAAGNNNAGIAGVAWRTNLQRFSLLSSPNRRLLVPYGWNQLLWAIQDHTPRVLNISVDVKLDTMPVADQTAYIDQYAGSWRQLLDSLPQLLIVLASGNEGLTETVAAYRTRQRPALFRASLLTVRLEPGYQNRIVVVSGTEFNNSRWQDANVFSDATDIAAPADYVLVLDTLRTNPQTPYPLFLDVGTSLAAPMVSGAASLLLTMDPTLSVAALKSYLIDGSAATRFDSLTGGLVAPQPVSGNSFYQLDVYGSLQKLSRDRPGVPVCGYPVTAGYYHALFHRNGTLTSAVDSVRVPIAGNPIGRLSVAKGGRILAAYTGIDSLAGNGPSVITFTTFGQRITNWNGYGSRQFLDGGVAEIRQFSIGGSTRQELTLGEGKSGYIFQLTLPDGSPVSTALEGIAVSPDGRFAVFPACRTSGGQTLCGVYAKRFADQVTTTVRECAHPCGTGGGCQSGVTKAIGSLWLRASSSPT